MKQRACYKCTKRYVGCHSTCKEYAADNAEAYSRKIKIEKARHDYMMAGYATHSIKDKYGRRHTVTWNGERIKK